ncbi:MAG: hypothetical protein AAF928_03595 [Myxococcota bacterium]
MEWPEPWAVVAAGARTPLALGAQPNALTLRTGMNALGGLPYQGRDRDYVLGGAVELFPWDWSTTQRAAALAASVTREALEQLRRDGVVRGTELLAVWGTSVAGAGAEVERSVRRICPDGTAVQVVEEGAQSTVDLLALARDEVAARRATTVLWGGAHSDISAAAVAALIEQDRLCDPLHLDAVIPGEGAAVVALRRGHGRARATLSGAGVAPASFTDDDDLPVDATAWTTAVKAAVQGAPAGWVVSDLGYEGFRMREWEAVQLRARAQLGEPFRWEYLAQRTGRLGAALIPWTGAVVAAGANVGWAPSTSVLATGGTSAGRRAAVWWESTPLTKEELAQTRLAQEKLAQQKLTEQAGALEERAEPRPRGVEAGRTEP